jgi:clan AA aspartic protease (TIGR02281 family)
MKYIVMAALAAFCLASAAQADPCKLTRVTMLDMESHDGHADIPLTINGETEKFVIDTGGAVTAIASEAAGKLGLPRHVQNHSAQVIFGGAPITQYVAISRLTIGTIKGFNVNMAVLPDGVMEGEDGLLGVTILGAYDIDFDFASGKFSMFSQQHCYGGVVYWTRTEFATVPIRLNQSHHITLDVSVDGKATYAALDTGAPGTIMSLEYAESAFGIDPKSPDLKAVPRKDTGGGAQFYRYPFKTLSFGAVTVNNPEVYLISDADSDTLGGGARPKMLIGLNIISKLHLYIAYGEHNLYITPANAH